MSAFTDFINSQFPTNNSRDVTAARLRTVFNYLDNNIGLSSTDAAAFTQNVQSMGLANRENFIVMTGDGAKTVTIPENFPEYRPLTICNVAATGDISIVFPNGGVWGNYTASDVFTIKPDAGGTQLLSGPRKSFRASLKVMKVPNINKWLILS